MVSKFGPPIRHEGQPKTKSALVHFAFGGLVGQGNRSRAFPAHWRGTDLGERVFGKTVAPDLAPRLRGVLHTAVGPLATPCACLNGSHRCIFLSSRWFLTFSQMCFLSWRLFQWFSQMHFPIMTLVSMVLTDAFSYHDVGCYWLSQIRFPIITLVSMVLINAFSSHDAGFYCFSQMHFPIMTPVSMVFTDAFSYHDAGFYSFSQMHFPIMTPVSMVLTDAFSYHDAGFYCFHRSFFLS